jgi:endonuclease YncB( thermonuclease family)
MGKGMILSGGKYQKLVLDVRKLLDQGRSQAQTALNREVMRTYWNVGKRLALERLSETAGYGQSVMEHLAYELKVDRSTLVRCLQFHQYYPQGSPPGTTLSWSHVRHLLTVKDDGARTFYEKTAQEKEWTQDELGRAIRADEYGNHKNPAPQDKPKPAPKLPRPQGGPFIYRAEIVRVVDGDTLRARLDLGFDVWKLEIIRLAGIDAPGMREDGGPEAYNYVQTQLAKAKVVVIATNKEDVHGRYIGHVFYSTDDRDNWEKVFKEGRYLNQELLNQGLARAY